MESSDYPFGDTDGKAVAARIDRRIDSLPGLGGLQLLGRTVSVAPVGVD